MTSQSVKSISEGNVVADWNTLLLLEKGERVRCGTEKITLDEKPKVQDGEIVLVGHKPQDTDSFEIHLTREQAAAAQIGW